jgi:hypothetical protein
MQSSILIGQELQIGPKPGDQGSGPRQVKLCFNLHGITLE